MEIAIKHSLGKLVLHDGLTGLLTATFVTNGFERMDIEPEHLR